MADPLHRRPVRSVPHFAAACILTCSAAVAQAPHPAKSAAPINVPSIADQIIQHKQALAKARDSHNQRSVESELLWVGSLYYRAGQPQEALKYLDECLPLTRSLMGRPADELDALDFRGASQRDIGKNQEALNDFAQMQGLAHASGDRTREARALANMGGIYFVVGDPQKALEYYDRSLPMWRDLGDKPGQASVLNQLGVGYSRMGRNEKALDEFQQALSVWREAKDQLGEANTLDNVGLVYLSTGEIQKALTRFNEALSIQTQANNPAGEAFSLSSIGVLYNDLGEREKALEFYKQALALYTKAGNRREQATVLSNIGTAYSSLGQFRNAINYLNAAWPIRLEMDDRTGEAWTLNSVAWLCYRLGQKDKALANYNQALTIERRVADRHEQAETLWEIGGLSDPTNELRSYVAALSLAKAVGDPDLQGSIQSSLMAYFKRQKQPEAAILFGLNAVNSFQTIRGKMTGLDRKEQIGFVRSKSNTYRQLAELLVQADRLGEAEQVLDLLKEQELKETVRGAADNANQKAEPLPLTPAQQKAQGELATPEKAANAVTDLSIEYATLLAKPTRTAAEETRFKTLDARIEAGNGDVSAFFNNTLFPALAQQKGAEDANTRLNQEKSEVSKLQNTLAGLGPRVLGIRLLMGEDHAYAILIAAHSRQKVELKAPPAELRSAVLRVRSDLRSPTSNPNPDLAGLYAMVVAPLEPELKALEAQRLEPAAAPVPTLLWSLDGVLRYVPIAALFDGTHYMAERFNNVLFTPDSYGHMASPQNQNSMRVLAMGLSKSYGGLPALPGVMPELEAVVHDPAVPASHGPLDGRLLPDEQFTLAALKSQLGAGSSFPVVHIASHFVIQTGSAEPYLMIGGENAGDPQGYALTLSRIDNSTISFHGTHLLTLSACSTAKGDVANDGREMDSLGMIAQQKDAEAVLGTLWDVSDSSTSRLMSDFYARWVQSPDQGKAEALRQAQLDLLHGVAYSSGSQSSRGFDTIADKPGNPAGYSHPYYWAPFVLTGNFQ